tara:strand:- start:1982 stop:2245 length:264 start_codon:yes stop_codon:yes gene_type:complete
MSSATGFNDHPWGDQKMMITGNNGAVAMVDETGSYHCFPCHGFSRGHHNTISNSVVYQIVKSAAAKSGYRSGAVGVKCGAGNKHNMS